MSFFVYIYLLLGGKETVGDKQPRQVLTKQIEEPQTSGKMMLRQSSRRQQKRGVADPMQIDRSRGGIPQSRNYLRWQVMDRKWIPHQTFGKSSGQDIQHNHPFFFLKRGVGTPHRSKVESWVLFCIHSRMSIVGCCIPKEPSLNHHCSSLRRWRCTWGADEDVERGWDARRSTVGFCQQAGPHLNWSSFLMFSGKIDMCMMRLMWNI